MSYFATQIMDEEGNISYALTGAGYGVLIAVMLAVLLLGCMISGSSGRKINTKQLVFSAMAIALGMVTSMVKLVDMPMGGSVTLCSMMFICLIGYMFGLRTGLTAAIAYGFLQLIVDPYIISVPQMLTDYILAFGALGLSGMFKDKKHGMVLGYIVGVLGRYFFTFLSGMIFFGSYGAYYNMSAPIYSLVYNGAYLGLEALVTVVILLLPPVCAGLSKVRNMAGNAL
ncbi:MAG: energy-coupled thiamine transporter ThiT [Lachnospiraceae bacterium]|nr:energy-coupled thiamine transporter ThiT [Lachnospiraceae bacterium]MDE6184016.1 energy-coupled thiamine transporter ThiT [Lachnospiraceae bacterium]